MAGDAAAQLGPSASEKAEPRSKMAMGVLFLVLKRLWLDFVEAGNIGKPILQFSGWSLGKWGMVYSWAYHT